MLRGTLGGIVLAILAAAGVRLRSPPGCAAGGFADIAGGPSTRS